MVLLLVSPGPFQFYHWMSHHSQGKQDSWSPYAWGHICGCSHPVAHLEPDGLSLTYVSYGWCWFSAGPCASNRLARASSHGSQLLEEVGEGASPSGQGSACTTFVDIRQSHMAKEVNVGVYSTNVWTQEAMIHWDHYCNSLVGHITFHI